MKLKEHPEQMPDCPESTCRKLDTCDFEQLQTDLLKEFPIPRKFFELFPGARTFPQIIMNEEKIGGYAGLVELLTNEE